MAAKLSAAALVQIWEMGYSLSLLDRALLVLAFALPGQSRDELASLTLGQRDAALLWVREQTFGPHLTAVANCPGCNNRLELNFNVSDVRTATGDSGLQTLTLEDWQIEFRLPNSFDLAAVLAAPDRPTAAGLLAQRCTTQLTKAGQLVTLPQLLPEPLLDRLAERMSECDPQAEVLLNLTCPSCGQEWQLLFDIAGYLWTEIDNQACHLLREVHVLASAYGWSESAILGLSATRRRLYLEMVEG